MKTLPIRPAALLWSLAIAIALVAGLILGRAYLDGAGAEPEAATVLDEPRPLPEVQLVNADGDAFGRDGLTGGWHLLFFGFTNCPDVCPNTLGLLSGVERQIEEQGARPPRVVFVSVDPRRDDPAKLRAYLDHFGGDFVGVTGSRAEIERLTQALYVPFSYVGDVESGDYTVDHSGALVLVDPRGRAVAYFTPPHDPAVLATDLHGLTEG